ncbi:insulinase family protein [Chrysosporum bergii ANA360D]|jgi:predicted Zn-dependent peptidase|uniref:Insulinase family protein n=1 Tax=Chrysosporum bergii ANA360D TaxID=617107 RepID=A0AA43GPN3_9CYAN|nr:pitrilysin family protein [Chrysosporum bergii]MDH6059155.1 insulinase family protein [Chrysosporum bergii ANA360D]
MTPTLLKLAPINSPTVHHLPNGLTIVAEQMPVEAVNLSLWVKIGSAVESDAINGMAHFLEHMIFKGSEKLASGEFERQIEERGAVTNAATSQDYTHYYITTAPQDFTELAPLQIDVVLNPTIPDIAFAKERLVVLEEIRRSQDNPQRRTFRRAMETAFEKLPYRRPVLGTEAIISQLQPQEMRDFHATWYQPQSITAVAVGNLPVEKLIATVAEGFSHAQQSTTNNPPFNQLSTIDPEPAFTKIVRREYIDHNLQAARLVMVWRVPGLGQLNHVYRLDILASILAHGQTSRLVRDLREEKQLVTSIAASNMTNKLQGTFYISAKCAVENLPAVEEAIIKHISTLQTEPVSEKEISRIQRRVANKFIFGNETPSDRAGLYGYYQSMINNLQPALNYPHHIQSQDPAHLMEAAQQYLSPHAYGVVVTSPLVETQSILN